MTRPGKRHLLSVAVLPLLWGTASAQATAQTPEAPSVPATEEEKKAAAPATPVAPAAGASYDLHVDAAAGVRLGDVSGSREKFEEYGRVNDAFVIDRLRLQYQRPGSADYLEFRAQDATQDDESYRLAVGRQGRYRVSVGYTAIPHLFSGGRFLWGGFGTGDLRIADVVQEQLQASEATSAERGAAPPSTTDPTAPNAEDTEQQRIVNGLYSASNSVRFRLDRRQTDAALEVSLSRDATAWVRVRNENRTGARRIGTGTYERWFDANTGTAHTRDLFITLGAELAEPIDYRTFGLDAGAGIAREGWLADVQYTFTRFRNFDSALHWDNPFRATNAPGTGLDRGRFTVGQLVLTPDSTSHEVTASGAIDLPLHGRLGASVSYGIVTQDEAFEPYTLNSFVIATDFAGTAVGPASSAALPARDLGGDVHTLAGTLSASVRPLDPLSVSARYRVYRYEDRSDEIAFPGYAAFGESQWRRERADIVGTNPVDVPVTNEPFDYWRHEADVDFDYRVTRMLSVSLLTGWEAWRFDKLRVDKLDEYTLGGGFMLRPMRNASLKGTYRYSDRTNDGYYEGSSVQNPEARGLLNFNWADRKRHLASARAQYSPTRMVSLGAIGTFADEEYGGDTETVTPGLEIVNRFRFGRSEARRWLGSVDVVVTPAERLSFQASYGREYRKEKMRSGAKDDGGKGTDDFGFTDSVAPENYWNSNITDTVDSLGVGATFQIIPERLLLSAGYNLSFDTIEVDTFNPNPIVATTLANARANDWPDITSRLHEVIADLGFRLTRNVRAGLRYQFSAYDLDDFAWAIDPYMAGRTVENSTRYVFAGATYNAFEAHVGTAYVGGSF